MPKNKGKGGKNRKRGKNEDCDKISRELVYKNEQEGEDYGQVLRLLGGCNIEVLCLKDGVMRICHIGGKFNRRIWIKQGDLVLISVRGFEDKGDVLLKYTDDEAKKLQIKNEIPRHININELANNSNGNQKDFEIVTFDTEENLPMKNENWAIKEDTSDIDGYDDDDESVDSDFV